MTTASVRRRFRVLDVGLELEGPAGFIEPIAAAYRRFAVDENEAPCRLDIEMLEDAVLVNGRRAPLVPSLDPTAQLYHRLQMGLMDTIDTHAVFHAAALEAPDGRVALLAAPSGHGKSSLTLELAARGWRFLGDDYAPLSFGDGLVTPYPRAVGIVPGGSAPIPDPFLRAAAGDVPQLLGKSLVDVGWALGERALVNQPLPLGHVFLLTSGREGASPAPSTTVALAAREENAADLDDFFDRTPGLTIEERGRGEGFRTWRLTLRHEAGPSERLAEVLSADRVLFFEKHWDDLPSFAGPVTAQPVQRLVAAEHLGRELLNRRLGGAFLERYQRSLPGLFMDVAGALAGVRCWTVTAGPCPDTADTIVELTR